MLAEWRGVYPPPDAVLLLDGEGGRHAKAVYRFDPDDVFLAVVMKVNGRRFAEQLVTVLTKPDHEFLVDRDMDAIMGGLRRAAHELFKFSANYHRQALVTQIVRNDVS